jgi:hypothetical protein
MMLPAPNTAPADELQVDFRYTNSCLMMFLDGHSQAQAAGWVTLDDLESSPARIKVRNLHQN